MRERLPRAARLGLALLGLASLVLGLSISFYLLLGMGMSHGHGGDAIPSLRTLLVCLLPLFLISMGVVGIICTTMERLTLLCALLILFLVDLMVVASL